MANGVVCPYCKSNLERDVQLEERVTCSECNKSFKVREHMIDAFNKKANPSLGKRMGLGTLKIVGGIIGFFIVLFLAVNLLMWQNSDLLNQAHHLQMFNLLLNKNQPLKSISNI